MDGFLDWFHHEHEAMPLAFALGAAAAMALAIARARLGAAIRRRQGLRMLARHIAPGAFAPSCGDSACAIYMLDAQGRVLSWSDGARQLTGYTAAEVIGSHVSRFHTPQDRADGVSERVLDIALATGKCHTEGWRTREDGSTFWAEILIEPLNDRNGRVLGFAKVVRDMTEMRAQKCRLAVVGDQLDAALENMHQGLCLFDRNGVLQLANARFLDMWHLGGQDCPPGVHYSEIAARALTRRLGGPPPRERLERLNRALHACLVHSMNIPTVLEFMDGMAICIANRRLPDGGWVSTFEDITERRRSEARLEHMAMHDSLTDLPNRSQFRRQLEASLAPAGEAGERLAVVAIDLDRFKELNDTRGHAAGDEALRALAMRLKARLHADQFVARIGGDEFAACCRFRDRVQLDGFLADLLSAFIDPVELATGPFGVGASMGVSIYPDDGLSCDRLIGNADLAMYRAKTIFGNAVCRYEGSMDETARRRRQLATDLRYALDRDQLQLKYQEQRDLRSGGLCGYEALIRWQHPDHGLIAPDDFIPIAEQTGEIIRIGEWVLWQACAEAARWERPLRVAVNLSPVQLLQPDLSGLIGRILTTTGLPATRLELEITETAIISDRERALRVLHAVKAHGVCIAIDDFGTGYSSLDTLHAFPFDKIKIDKSFLRNAQTNSQAHAIIRAVLALGHTLEIPVLAEGVETLAQLDLLNHEGCAEAQGFYFGRPEDPPSRTAAAAPGSAAADREPPLGGRTAHDSASTGPDFPPSAGQHLEHVPVDIPAEHMRVVP